MYERDVISIESKITVVNFHLVGDLLSSLSQQPDGFFAQPSKVLPPIASLRGWQGCLEMEFWLFFLVGAHLLK